MGKLNKVINLLKSNILVLMSANLVNKIVAMMSNMVITRILTVTQFGIWSYTFNIYSYLSLLSGLGLLSGAFVYGAENKGSEKANSYYRYCLKKGLFVNAILIVIVILSTMFIPLTIQDSAKYIRVYSFAIIGEFIFNSILNIMRCNNKIKEYARALNTNTIMTAVGTCIGAIFGIYGVVISRLLAITFSCIILIYNNKETLKNVVKANELLKVEIKDLWRYSLFTGISAMLNTVVYLLDVTMIASILSSTTEVAIYKVATFIPSALVIVPTSIITCVLPDLVYKIKNRQSINSDIKKIFISTFTINLIICSSLIILAYPLIILLSGHQYIDAIPVFRILVISYFFNGTFRSISTNILAGMKKIKYNISLSLITIILDIIFNICLINRYGMIGAAYATLSVSIIASVIAFSYVYNIVKKGEVGE